MQYATIRIRQCVVGLAACLSMLWATASFSAPPYDVTINFNAPSSGPTPDSYNFYIDDCAVTGALAPAFATVTPGQTFAGAITADGIYEMCIRVINATGETPDPGPVATVDISDLPLSNPVENLDVQIACPNGGCTVLITVTP